MSTTVLTQHESASPLLEFDGPPKKLTQVKSLVDFVQSEIAKAPHMRGGHKWCARTQPEIAAAVGVSVRTLQTLIKSPPFCSENALVGEGSARKKIALIRISAPGECPHPTPETIACGMRKEFLARYGDDMKANGKFFTPRMHGCFVGLAQLRPEGAQMDIFKTVLDKWSEFMAGVSMVIEFKKEAKLDPKAIKMFFTYPSPSVIRRFYGVAIQLHGLKLQEEACKTGVLKMSPSVAEAYFTQDQFFGHLTADEIIALDGEVKVFKAALLEGC